MLRSLLLCMTTLVLSTAAHAAVEVDFIPSKPGACSDDFYLRSTSLNLLKVKESDDKIKALVRINYFDCHGKFASHRISQTPAKLATLLPDEFTWPWSDLPDVQIQSRLSSSGTSAEVAFEFNKADILEGGTSGSKSYRLIFAPERMEKGYVFEWQAQLDVSLTNGSKLRLMQIQH